jgi:uncharacterized damage-inducible protein DinB
MPVYTTHTLLPSLKALAEDFLQQAERWLLLPQEKLVQQPAPNKWSLAQCLEHLNSYAQYYHPAMQKALQKHQPQQQALFRSGWLGNYFTNLMMPAATGKQKKMKAPAGHSPQATLNGIAVIQAFIQQQKELIRLMEKAEQYPLQKIKVPISIAPFIRLRLGDVLLFMSAHNYRHMLQAAKALQSAGAATAAIKKFDLHHLQQA